LGISLYPDDAADGQKMIRNADAAMYQAKGAGRNAFHFYTSDLTDRALGACPSNTKTGFSRTKNQ
jgi:predicted signal transduction protein with EAL and GGDEF domain